MTDESTKVTASGGARVVCVHDDMDDPMTAANPGYHQEKEIWGAHAVLQVVGHGVIVRPKHYTFSAPAAIIRAADLESLAEAVRDPRNCCSSLPETINIATGDLEHYDPERYDADDITLLIDNESVYACVVELVSPSGDGSYPNYQEVLSVAAEPYSCSVTSVTLSSDEIGRDWPDIEEYRTELAEVLAAEHRRPQYVEVRVVSDAPSSAGNLIDAAHSVRALLLALSNGAIDVRGVAGLVRANFARLLIGLAENEWFDAKSRNYQVDDRAGPSAIKAKISLAQDVASFANGSQAAIIVIGLETARIDGVDVVAKDSPVAHIATIAKQYADIIYSRIYPTVEGLVVEQIIVGDKRSYVIIEIPEQPREFQPFLVHGAIVGDRVEGGFFSIPRRRGEGAISITASQVHATLAAGRALLRGSPG